MRIYEPLFRSESVAKCLLPVEATVAVTLKQRCDHYSGQHECARSNDGRHPRRLVIRPLLLICCQLLLDSLVIQLRSKGQRVSKLVSSGLLSRKCNNTRTHYKRLRPAVSQASLCSEIICIMLCTLEKMKYMLMNVVANTIGGRVQKAST